MLWYGSPAHEHCLNSIIDPIQAILKRYPNSKLILFGHCNRAAWDGFPSVEFIEPVLFSKFYQRLNAIGHDVVLTPLIDSVFNRSRSAVRYYESAMCWKSAVCVASKEGAFADEIEDGRTGMLFRSQEELYHKVSLLIERPELRHSIAAQGREWCMIHRCPEAVLRSVWPRIEDCVRKVCPRA
jgi:hypothetical protein